jgi:hypothetical protein
LLWLLIPLVIVGVLVLPLILLLIHRRRRKRSIHHLDPRLSAPPPIPQLAPRSYVMDPTPAPPLRLPKQESELTRPLPWATQPPATRSMAPIIICAEPRPVPLREPVLPPVAAKIPESIQPAPEPPKPVAPTHAPTPAPALVPPPMPPAPPKRSAQADEVLGFLQGLDRASAKVAPPSRGRRLLAVLAERLDEWEAALADTSRRARLRAPLPPLPRARARSPPPASPAEPSARTPADPAARGAGSRR